MTLSDNQTTPPEQRERLDSDFKTFFAEIDGQPTPEPPTAPKPPRTRPPEIEQPEPAPELEPEPVATTPDAPKAKESATRPSSRPPEVEVPVKEPPKAVEQPEKDELEDFEPHPKATPEQRHQFRELKQVAKNYREKAKAYETKISPILTELGVEVKGDEDLPQALEQVVGKLQTLKSGSMAPEVQAEFESLRAQDRMMKVYDGSAYNVPIRDAYQRIIDRVSSKLPAAQEAVAQWVEQMRAVKPETIADESWAQMYNAMDPADPIAKQEVANQISQLKHLNQSKLAEVANASSNESSYDRWRHHREEEHSRAYDAAVRDEVDQALKGDKQHLKDWIPGAKATEEEIAKFKTREKVFSDVLFGFHSGPRKAARIALEVTEMTERIPELEKSIADKDASIAEKDAEIERLKREITGRRRAADAPFRPSIKPTKTTPEKAPLPKDSRGSLNDAFKNWDT